MEEFNNIIKNELKDLTIPADYKCDCFVTSEVKYNEIISKCSPSESDNEQVYIGLGPCQNFTYISNYRPKFAIIFDARIDNLIEHLMFKVIFEHCETPLEFLEMLFSRKINKELIKGKDYNANNLISVFEEGQVDEKLYIENKKIIKDYFITQWNANNDIIITLDKILDEFYRRQLTITSVNESALKNLDIPSYKEIILASNSSNSNFHFLTSIERYEYVRKMHLENKIIPILGNIIDLKTIEKIKKILDKIQLKISMIYLSNMEEFLINRYTIKNDKITSWDNKEGLLKENYLIIYEKLIRSLEQLPITDNCLLIRFFFPCEYNNRKIGYSHWLQEHITFLNRFLKLYRNEKPESIIQTYFY